MSFKETKWDILLPSYLVDTEKDRLKQYLLQFFDPKHRENEKRYDNFYHTSPPNYFLQGDLIKSIPSVFWDYQKGQYSFQKSPVILLSNTCDVNEDNERLQEKQAIYAPITYLDFYLNALKEIGLTDEQIKSTYVNLRNQTYSNIFYLPPILKNGKEAVILFDTLYSQPATILQESLSKINTDRIASLSHFGLYLLLSKLSYHFCRVPENDDRKEEIIPPPVLDKTQSYPFNKWLDFYSSHT